MERVQNSGIDEPPPPPRPSSLPSMPKPRKHKKFLGEEAQIKSSDSYTDNINKYSKEANEAYSRGKRAARSEENKNTCSLYIQTDPLIWRHIREGFPEVNLSDLFRKNGCDFTRVVIIMKRVKTDLINIV